MAEKPPVPEDSAQFRTPDYREWARVGILQYLDLKAWEKQAEVTIPNRVMADAIFPHGEGGEEVVRKTTAKLADEVLRGGRVLDILASMCKF